MRMRPNGIDVFYIDESNDRELYVATAVAVPFLRPVDGAWWFTWHGLMSRAQAWRKAIATDLKIPTTKELHGTKLLGGRGNYLYGERQFTKEDAVAVYRDMLKTIEFLPDASIMTVVCAKGSQLYGYSRLEQAMYALFQRMRMQCNARNVNAMVFFDQGHPEYRDLYRRACTALPTGSAGGLGTRNLPLDMFVKDGNEKTSSQCLFTQIADLVAFAAPQKVRAERKLLDEAKIAMGHGAIYDELPLRVRNTRVGGHERDGIKRLW